MSRKIFQTIIALALSQTINAQNDSSVNALDEVVVTATKYPLKLSETGKVLTVISQEQIERSAGKTLPQLLTEQTGLIVNGANSNPGKDKSVYLWGASNDYTLILLDGVPVIDPSGISGGAFDLRLLPLDEIERIEILKGSQSTLYGSNAVAGVINIITKKGGKKPLAFSGGASYGSYNSFSGNADLHGSSRIIDYTANYMYTTTDGISEATDTTGNANFDKDGFRRQAFESNLTVHAAKNLDISPYYRYSYYKDDFDADAFTDGKNTFTYLLNNTGLIAAYKLPNGSITANYGYTFAKRNYTSDYGPYGYTGSFHTGEIYYTQAFSKYVRLLAGINAQSYQLKDTSLPHKNPQTSIISPYVSLSLQSGNGFSLELGGRYNNHSKFGSYTTYSINAAYLINNQVKIFADISTGFKAPSVTQLFGLYGANENLKPETSFNPQAGVQAFLLQKKLTLSATAFSRKIKNLIAYLDNGYINIDRQNDKGLEAEAIYKPNNKINLKASYTYVTGEIHQTRNEKDTSYYNLIRRPKNSFTASAGYQITKQLYISASLQSLGKRTDLYFNPSTYNTDQVNLDAYTLLNAYAEYNTSAGRLRFFIDAKNVTDTKYTEVYGYNTLGFNLTGGIRVNF